MTDALRPKALFVSSSYVHVCRYAVWRKVDVRFKNVLTVDACEASTRSITIALS